MVLKDKNIKKSCLSIRFIMFLSLYSLVYMFYILSRYYSHSNYSLYEIISISFLIFVISFLKKSWNTGRFKFLIKVLKETKNFLKSHQLMASTHTWGRWFFCVWNDELLSKKRKSNIYGDASGLLYWRRYIKFHQVLEKFWRKQNLIWLLYLYAYLYFTGGIYRL